MKKFATAIFVLILSIGLSAAAGAGCKKGTGSGGTPPADSPSSNDGTDSGGGPGSDGSDVNDGGENSDSGDDSSSIDPEKTLTVVFTGDTMLARKVGAKVDSNNGDYRFPFHHVADYLNSADITFVNLESIISDQGTPNEISQYLAGIAFRAAPAAVNGLTYAGVDIVSMANNHTFDYGRDGMEDCLNRLTSAGIIYTGAGFTYGEAYSPRIIEAKGTKVAFLAYTMKGNENWRAMESPARSGLAWLYTKNLNQGISEARNSADIVVVSIHFGLEYETLPSGQQDRYAHLAIDQGADLVIGHHPHVIQPVMVYMKGYIAYSLGNFVFDQSETATRRGMMLEVIINEGRILNVKRKYVNINNDYQPVIEQ